MARISTILFDLDGTLVDSHRDIAQAFQRALRSVTEETLPSEGAVAQHIGKPLEEMARALGYRFSQPQLTRFLTSYRGHFATQGMPHTRPYPGVTASLQTMPTLTFGVVTTKSQEQAETVLHQLGLAHHFRHVQGWRPGMRLKPDPAPVLDTLEALQCQPEHALMVGDTPADILAGKAAGVRTCAVTYGFGNRDDLLKCEPSFCIESFHILTTIVLAENGVSHGS